MNHWLVTYNRDADLKVVLRVLAAQGCQRTEEGPPQHGDVETMILAVIGPANLPDRVTSLVFIRDVTPDPRYAE